jgi:hypothetical protein
VAEILLLIWALGATLALGHTLGRHLVEQELLVEERRRTDDLTRLIEARSAPAEYAAFLQPPSTDPGAQYRYDETGLVRILVEEE